jgi:Cu-Zn family superoxide dismutase
MRNILAVVTLTLLAVPAFAKAPKGAVVVPIKTSDGKNGGTATFIEQNNKLEIKLDLQNLPPGQHAVHIHEHALCDAPEFKSAGGHFNPAGKQHGMDNPNGHHNGDLPHNVTANDEGMAQANFKVDYLSLSPSAPNSILANGGTSIMVHEKPDDMKTDPTGNAGVRIACGVITAPTP